LAIFTDRIICGKCERLFKRKNARGKYKWSCQSTINHSKCGKNLVSEDALIEFISRKLFLMDRTLDKVTLFITDYVERIVVNEKNDFTVFIRGQEPMFMKPNHVHY
jgi:hypothetical protein